MVPPSSRLKKLNNLSYSFCVHPFSALFSSKVADSHFLFEFPVVYLTILPSSFRFLIYLLLSGSDDLRRHLPKFLRSVLIRRRRFHIFRLQCCFCGLFSGSVFSRSESQRIANNFLDFLLFVSCPAFPRLSGKCPEISTGHFFQKNRK